MANTIATNVASLNAQRNLSKTSIGLNRALQRLSSGLRINSARDDAAGLQISNRLTSQIGGLTVAARNANDGISLAQVAEGAMDESTKILQRIRDLSIQAANGTNSASDRSALNDEVVQLQQELTRIATTTRFGNRNLLDGTFGTTNFQVGAKANETISVSLTNVKATAIGNNSLNLNGTGVAKVIVGANLTAVTHPITGGAPLVVTGPLGQGTTASLSGGDSALNIAAAINSVGDLSGVSADARTVLRISGLATGNNSFQISTGSNKSVANQVTISANITSASDLQSIADEINKNSATLGLQAVSNGSTVDIISESGDDVNIDGFANDTTGNQTLTLTTRNYDNTASTASTATLQDVTGPVLGAVITGQVRVQSSGAFTLTTADATVNAATGNATSSKNSVDTINISTAVGAQQAIDIVDAAIQTIDKSRAQLGAVQNRFGSTISNLQNVSENVSAARSRIRDADFAAETANLSKYKVLQQAGLAILAQANASTQGILRLLQ